MITLNITRKVGLIDKFKELGFKNGVEIGTDRGGYARDICERFPEVALITIDPWLAYTEGTDVKEQAEVDALYEEAEKTLAPYKNCKILRMTSAEAVEYFEPNSIDFVFIDGNHEYTYVMEDIINWTKIVKPGGIVCGHDYVSDPVRKYGVIEAVNDYVKENNIDPLYVLKKGSFVPCWLFYKK